MIYKQLFFFSKKLLTKNNCLCKIRLEQLFTKMEVDYMRTRYKIISKTRFYLFILTLLIILAISILFLIDKRAAYSNYYENIYEEFQVADGDTLWDIARIYLSSDQDIRKVVYDIKKFNNMTSEYIYPGDVIKVPIEN